MKTPANNHRQTGYTLVELLLYVVIVGILLTGVTTFFGVMVEARVKNQSISEVNDQGILVADYLAQTIRNASSITSPAAASAAASLTLAVPTGSLSPTVFDISGTLMGLNIDGGTTDSSDSSSMNATKIIAAASGTISTLYAYVGPTVAASPNNKAQMAIYSGATPTTLLASSSDTVISPSSWNAFSISPVSVTSGQTYWLAYNTNGLVAADNDLRYRAGAAGQSMYIGQTYGTWPNSWTGTSQGVEFSMYGMIDAASTPGAVRVKEGSGSVIPLTNTKVQLSGLLFRNLTRAGTPGVVQFSFTLSRVNSSNRNEYSYQKTFTGSAEVGW